MFGCEYKSYYLQAELKGLPLSDFLKEHYSQCEECQARYTEDMELKEQYERD